MTQMQAIQKHHAGEGFKLIDAPVPQPGPGEVRIKVLKTSICGTDVHITAWDEWSASRIKPPMIYGHEFCGTVDALGEGVDRVAVGDYVSAEMHRVKVTPSSNGSGPTFEDTHVIYGVDAPGCFAEYVVLPQWQCVKLPESITPEVAACLDSIGNAVHAATQVDLNGKRVFISGCGPIGLYCIPVARALGATQVFAADVTPYRLELAQKANPDAVWNPMETDVAQAIEAATDGQGVDVVLEMSGNARAITTAFSTLAHYGSMVCLGIPPEPIQLDLNRDVIFKSTRLIGVNGREIFRTWDIMLDLLASGKVDIDFILTHHFPLSEFGQAMDIARSGQSGKIILTP